MVKEEFDIKVGIFEGQEVDEQAAKLQGYTLDEFRRLVESFRMPAVADEIYEPPLKAYGKLKAILDSYIDKYDRSDKFIVAGYNVGFDISFLEAFFGRMGDKGKSVSIGLCRKPVQHKLAT